MPGWPAPGYSNCGSGTSLSVSLPSILEMQNLGPLPRLVESESAFQQDPKAIQTHIQVWEGWPRDPLPGQKESRLRCGEGAKREKVRVSELPPAGALKVSPWSGQASPQMAPENWSPVAWKLIGTVGAAAKSIHSTPTVTLPPFQAQIFWRAELCIPSPRDLCFRPTPRLLQTRLLQTCFLPLTSQNCFHAGYLLPK